MVHGSLFRRRSARVTPIRPLRLAILAVAFIAVLLALLVLPHRSGPDLGTATSVPPTAPPGPAMTVEAANMLLSERAAALRTGDGEVFERTGSDDELFRRVTALPVRNWRYDAVEVTASNATTSAARAVVAWRLAGDGADARTVVRLRFARDGDGWRVVDQQVIAPTRPLWDVGELSVRRFGTNLVIGVQGAGESAPDLDPWPAIVRAAVPRVLAVIPDDWRPRVTLVVPTSAADASALTARPQSLLRSIAAVTLDEAGTPVTGRSGAARVVVNPMLLSDASTHVRTIVIAHEVAHVATRSAVTTATPLWLEEGYASLIGYRNSGVPLSIAAADAFAAPSAVLPTATAFVGPDSALAYQRSLLACEVLRRALGWDGLLALYRDTAGGSKRTPDRNFKVALRGATDAGRSQLQVGISLLLRTG